MALMIELSELHKLNKHINNLSKIRRKIKNRKLLQRSKFIIISQQTILDFMLLNRSKNETGWKNYEIP